jgi:predicted transcriptional regulator
MEETESTAPIFVSELMTIGVHTCPINSSVAQIATLFIRNNLEYIVVIDRGQAVGVISQEELINAYINFENLDVISASDILNEVVPYIPAEIPLKVAAEIMKDKGAKALFVVHQSAGGVEYPAAVITEKHFIRHMAGEPCKDSQEMSILSDRQSPLQSFFNKRDEARRINLRNLKP